MRIISVFCFFGSLLFVFSYAIAKSKLATKVSHGDQEYVNSEINRLKDAIINQKTQLKLFRQLMLNEGIQTAYPKISFNFKNKLSERYRVFSVSYFIDGVRSYSFINDNITDPTKKSQLPDKFWRSLAPGRHSVKVSIGYMGNDTGIFSYLADYKVNMEAVKEFTFERGQNLHIDVIAYERGGIFTDFKERAQVELKIARSTKRKTASD